MGLHLAPQLLINAPLSSGWDPSDPRQHLLSINARQLRELDAAGAAVPENYRAALRGTLGATGLTEAPGAAGYPVKANGAKAQVKQTFY